MNKIFQAFKEPIILGIKYFYESIIVSIPKPDVDSTTSKYYRSVSPVQKSYIKKKLYIKPRLFFSHIIHHK